MAENGPVTPSHPQHWLEAIILLMTLSEFIIIREGTEPVWFRWPVAVTFGKAEVRKR
jgi:hypothetical protein